MLLRTLITLVPVTALLLLVIVRTALVLLIVASGVIAILTTAYAISTGDYFAFLPSAVAALAFVAFQTPFNATWDRKTQDRTDQVKAWLTLRLNASRSA
jgi:hypothetical protein